MSITKSSSFLFHGSAFGLSARFDHPIKDTIPTKAVAVLAPTGGDSASVEKDFRYRDMVMFQVATARAVGTIERDGSFNSDVTSTVRGLFFMQTVEAELVSARINTIHRIKERKKNVVDEVEITLTGSNIEGLHVAGKKIEIEWDIEAFSKMPTFEKLHQGKHGRALAHGSAKDQIIVDTIVKSLDVQPLSADERRRVADPEYILPGVRSDRNVLWVPHFGKIFIGEVIVHRGNRRINMLRMELGCGTGGGGSVGGGEGNGGEIPPAGP